MEPVETIEKLIRKFFAAKKSRIAANTDFDKAVLDDALAAYEKSMVTKPISAQPNVWRIIMKSPITKLTAAACIIIAVTFGLNIVFNKTVSTAYALAQTIKANEDIRYLRFKCYDPNEALSKEAWIQYDQNDNIQKIRVDMHDRWGKKVSNVVDVWNEGKTLVWNKEQARLDLFDCNNWTAKMLLFAERFDPKQAVEHLCKMQQEGKVKIEIEEGSDDEPIRITGQYLPGTYLIGKPDLPAFSDVLIVDPQTKLVTEIEVYKVGKNQMYVCVYKDYNYEPFDPNIFDIEKEAPSDVNRIDWSTADIGLPQEDLSDDEIAVKVVREVLEARINKDYVRVGKLSGGASAAEMQKRLKLNVVGVVSIGEPRPRKGANGICVPCTIEVETTNGKIGSPERHFFVERVCSQQDRWMMVGDAECGCE